MLLQAVLLASGLVALEAQETRKMYNGYQVGILCLLTLIWHDQMLRTEPASPEELKVVESLEEAVESWTPVVGGGNTSVDLTVDPKFIGTIKQLLKCKGIKYSTAILDIQVTDVHHEMQATTCTSGGNRH